jgi:Domain of unknown function (DUF1906)
MRRFALCLLALALVVPAVAGAQTVHFHGSEIAVPHDWPVYRLAEHPHLCVRLDRKAVYLGRPGADQRCPASAIGRRRAILVDPGAGGRARARASHVPPAHLSAASAYTGLGFDACTAPSRRSMSAWASSPYRAIGVYVGGVNRGCSQPNLTASWVSEQTAAGWSLIPTYVGLQAPTSSCGSCAKLSSSAAVSQGTEAANDAVDQARLAGIGAGSPIYFDMESYTRTTSASAATLNFLAAWTARLHALGYVSGVYSSGASGIADLADEYGSSYLEPDELWFANWNGRASAASDPYVPAGAWAGHRIHQYNGGHDESYGGVTINIDNDYVEGATAGTGLPLGAQPLGHLDAVSAALPGQVTISGWAFDPNAPTQALAIRAYVGGGQGERGTPYELGPVAVQARSDVALSHRAAGANHGFELSFPVTASGRQRICVYALGVAAGIEKALGCRNVGIRVPISIAGVKATEKALWVQLACEWPAGTECPGQIALRAHVRLFDVARRHGRRVVKTRVIGARLARRTFQLSGGRSHAFSVHLSSRGRLLTRGATELRAQLMVAVPGGRKGRGLTLRSGRGLPR